MRRVVNIMWQWWLRSSPSFPGSWMLKSTAAADVLTRNPATIRAVFSLPAALNSDGKVNSTSRAVLASALNFDFARLSLFCSFNSAAFQSFTRSLAHAGAPCGNTISDASSPFFRL